MSHFIRKILTIALAIQVLFAPLMSQSSTTNFVFTESNVDQAIDDDIDEVRAFGNGDFEYALSLETTGPGIVHFVLETLPNSGNPVVENLCALGNKMIDGTGFVVPVISDIAFRDGLVIVLVDGYFENYIRRSIIATFQLSSICFSGGASQCKMLSIDRTIQDLDAIGDNNMIVVGDGIVGRIDLNICDASLEGYSFKEIPNVDLRSVKNIGADNIMAGLDDGTLTILQMDNDLGLTSLPFLIQGTDGYEIYGLSAFGDSFILPLDYESGFIYVLAYDDGLQRNCLFRVSESPFFGFYTSYVMDFDPAEDEQFDVMFNPRMDVSGDQCAIAYSNAHDPLNNHFGSHQDRYFDFSIASVPDQVNVVGFHDAQISSVMHQAPVDLMYAGGEIAAVTVRDYADGYRRAKLDQLSENILVRMPNADALLSQSCYAKVADLAVHSTVGQLTVTEMAIENMPADVEVVNTFEQPGSYLDASRDACGSIPECVALFDWFPSPTGCITVFDQSFSSNGTIIQWIWTLREPGNPGDIVIQTDDIEELLCQDFPVKWYLSLEIEDDNGCQSFFELREQQMGGPGCCLMFVEVIEGPEKPNIFIWPNPVQTTTQFRSNDDDPIQRVEIYDLLGRRVFATGPIHAASFNWSRKTNHTGLYIARIATLKGEIVKQVILE